LLEFIQLAVSTEEISMGIGKIIIILYDEEFCILYIVGMSLL